MILIYILVVVLNETDCFEKIISKFSELGVSGGTIIDSKGMAETILCNDKIPTFGGLRQIFEHCRPSNKTIFSIIESKSKLNEVQKGLLETCDFTNPGIGIIFAVPIENAIGIASENLNTD